MAYSYDYPRPALSVDCVVFGLDLADDELKVLLIQRRLDPFADAWAMPGGFVDENELTDDAAARELNEEAGLSDVFLEQLYTFSTPHRDPRGWVVSVAYYALVNLDDHELNAATDAKNAAWFSVADVPSLAFDHADILDQAITRLKGKVRYQPIGFNLLPEKFTLSQLQKLYEIVLERALDKRNFRKKVLSLGILEELDEVQQDVAHRAARLYRFNKDAYEAMSLKGISFEL